jgi:hypothetical protein
MKNFILLVLTTFLTTSSLFAQTYSTGIVALPLDSGDDYSGKIDVTSSTVTLTLIGPSSGWLGMGFNATGMGSIGMDAVIFDGVNMSDRRFNGIGVEPPLDATQNWTVTSNTVNTGVRTVIATRARDTGDANDYVFPVAAQPINIAYARRIGSFGIAYHGAGSCSATTVNLTLGADSFVADAFKMYPNPSKGYLTIDFPQKVNGGEVKIYDDLGRVVIKQAVTVSENKIETSSLTSGTYIVVLRTEYGNATKNLVID